MRGKKVIRVQQDKLIEILQLTIREQSETITELQRIMLGMTQTIKELNERLGMNSKNSSKPPSSDGLSKPTPKSLSKPSGKKPGGQQGHSGSHLKITAQPDEIIPHAPAVCRSCPNYDACVNSAGAGETRSVIDAVVTTKVIAHQALVIACPLSGVSLKGKFPEDIKATVQYGENLQALTVALNTVGAVSVNRTHEILSGVFAIPLSTGTISNMVSRCANGLTGIVELIRQKVIASPIAHFDETGTRVDGKTNWVHSASNSEYTHLTINANRGKDGMDAGRVLPYFSGKAVHDCWAPYWKYPRILLHVLCCAHLLRELIAAQERHQDHQWAENLIKLLLEMKDAKERAISIGEDKLSEEKLRKFDMKYDEFIKQGYAENPMPPENVDAGKRRGRKKKGKTLALIERLDIHRASVCLFAHDFSVPFDNNLAERDIRMVKTKTKVSGCFRSLDGAESYLKIMSYVGTVKKHGFSAYEAIRQAISGNPAFFLAETF
jgi:transposase